MQLAAIWLKEHYLLGTTQINLGGKYFYKFEEDGQELKISREENKKYISRFFSDESPNLSLVSAIVGRNGSGKTTLLNVIRKVLKREFDNYEHALLIFELEKDKIRTHMDSYSNWIDKLEWEGDLPERLNLQFGNIQVSSDSSLVETVYHSPFLDLSDYYVSSDSSPDIDISLDRILQSDIRDNEPKEGSNPILEHRYQNIFRQFAFQSNPLALELNKSYQVPIYKSVELAIRSPLVDPKFFHNTPIEFRPFYEKLHEIWRREIYATKREISRDTELSEDRKIYKLWFLLGVINSLFAPLERSNTYLDEGKVKTMEIDLISCSLEEALYKFLDNHYFLKDENVSLPVRQIKNLVQTTFEIIDNSKKGDISGPKKITLNFQDATNILNLHKEFLEGMISFSDNAVGFIDTSPIVSGISSGEKAFLDLFSRFFFCTDIIDKRKNGISYPNYEKGFPNHFILMLDEGDLGFHPVWKKKYVKTIVSDSRFKKNNYA